MIPQLTLTRYPQVTPQAIFTSFKLPKSNQLPPLVQSPIIATVEEFPVSSTNHAI